VFRVFIDTNVLVYSVDERDPVKRQRARECMQQAEAAHAGVISTQILQEFFVVITRKVMLAPLAARSLVDDLPPFDVVVVDVALVRQAMEACIRNQLSLWDALIVVSARRARCNVIWTEDLSHGQIVDSVRIENPFLEAAGTGLGLVREVGTPYRVSGTHRQLRCADQRRRSKPNVAAP